MFVDIGQHSFYRRCRRSVDLLADLSSPKHALGPDAAAAVGVWGGALYPQLEAGLTLLSQGTWRPAIARHVRTVRTTDGQRALVGAIVP